MSSLNKKKLKFYIDDLLGSGSQSLLVWLALSSFLFILLVSAITWFAGISEHDRFGDLLWDLAMRALTPWEIEASMGSLPYLLVLLVLTLFGIFVLSILISFLSAIIDARVRAVAQGVQAFPFDNHVVIMGWSSRVAAIVEELVTANLSESESRVVIVSALVHEALEEAVKRELPDTRNTQIFFRSRKLDSDATFANINILGAKRVILLGDEHQPSRALDRLKTCIAVFNYFDQSVGPAPHVLVETESDKERRSLSRGSRQRAVLVDVSDLPARLIMETVFQPHLPEIFEEILSFSGSEIYLTDPCVELGLANRPFFECAHHLQGAIPFGILEANENAILNPAKDRICVASDRLIVLAEDDSSISVSPALSGSRSADMDPPVGTSVADATHKRRAVLLIGVSPSTPTILRVLQATDRCSLHLLTRCESDLDDEMRRYVSEQKIKWDFGELDDPDSLVALNVKQFDTVIVANAGLDNSSAADLEIIRSILLLTDENVTPNTPHLIAELNASDSRDIMARLVELDFVVSDKIGSKVFAQYVENPHLIQVIDSLICCGRHRIGIAPLALNTAEPLSFNSVRFHSESPGVVIGVRYGLNGVPHTRLNPPPDYEIPYDASQLELIYVE